MSQPKPLEFLLIEDNEGDVKLTQIAFEESDLDCNVRVAYDGQEGMEYIRKQGKYENAPTPDLVFLDINMPRMNGKEVLDAIKSDDQLKAIPVIMLTSSEAHRDVVESYKKHANCYINKPSNIDEFIDFAKRIQNFWVDFAVLP